MNEKHILLQIDEIRNMTFIEDKNDARLCENWNIFPTLYGSIVS